MQHVRDQYEAAMEGFVAELNRAHQAAGRPTYTELEQVSERLRARSGAARVGVLTRSNTNEILKGRRQRPPRWHVVQSFLIVLRVIARSSGIPSESIGTDAEWKRRYDAVCAAEVAVQRPASVGRHRKPAGLAGTHTADAATSTDYRGIAREWLDAYACFESAAKVVRTYEPRVIPVLLQAELYARTMLDRFCPGADGDEVLRLAEARMQRQARLDSPRFQMWAIVEEAALRSPDVDVHTMRFQITHLINSCERENVSLQVLPSASAPRIDDHVTIQEPITQFRFPEDDRDDVVFLERPRGGVILTDRSEIAHYSQLLSRLGMRAVSADETQALLRRIFMEL